MKKQMIDHVISQLLFDGEVEETTQSVRYKGQYFADDKVAEFTIIFPVTEDDSNEYKVQFNGRESQNLNRKHNLKDQISSVVSEAIETPANEVQEVPPVDLTEQIMQAFKELQGTAHRNTTTKKAFNREKRKARNKQARKSRRVNRLRAR